MLRKYELLYVLRHDSPAEATQATIDKIKDTITGQGGTILLHESWGKKKLAYEIKKLNKGIYQLTTFAGESSIIHEIERNLRINQEILRWLTVQLEEQVTDLAAEIEKYSQITPRMVPIDGEDDRPQVDERPAATGTPKAEGEDNGDDDEAGGDDSADTASATGAEATDEG